MLFRRPLSSGLGCAPFYDAILARMRRPLLALLIVLAALGVFAGGLAWLADGPLRVPGVIRDRQVILVDSERRELPASRYSSRVQPDGSHLVRMETQLLQGRAVHLEAKAPDGFGDPLGCVTGEVASN